MSARAAVSQDGILKGRGMALPFQQLHHQSPHTAYTPTSQPRALAQSGEGMAGRGGERTLSDCVPGAAMAISRCFDLCGGGLRGQSGE